MSKFKFKVEGTKLLIALDPNEDGQPVLKVEVDIMEIPDEIVDALKKK